MMDCRTDDYCKCVLPEFIAIRLDDPANICNIWIFLNELSGLLKVTKQPTLSFILVCMLYMSVVVNGDFEPESEQQASE